MFPAPQLFLLRFQTLDILAECLFCRGVFLCIILQQAFALADRRTLPYSDIADGKIDRKRIRF